MRMSKLPSSRRAAAALATLCVVASLACFLGAAHADVSQLVGEPAPDLRARPLDADEEIDPLASRDRPVLLAFVASWCGACRRMLPELDRLRERHEERALSIVRLSHEGRRRLGSHVLAQPSAIPILQCTGRTAVRYQADRLPTLVLVDRRGRVVAAHQGAGPEITRALRAEIAALLRE